jgi:hypothetical protein
VRLLVYFLFCARMSSGVSSTPFPRHIVRVSFSPLIRHHRARSIATPYSTSVSVPLYAITARSITNQRTSGGVGIGFTFLPHVQYRSIQWLQIKDMEFTGARLKDIHPLIIFRMADVQGECQWTPLMSFIWNDNMREKREANANATWRALIRDRPRGDGV